MKIPSQLKKIVLLAFIGLFITTSIAFAQDLSPTDFEEKDITVVPADEVINKDFFATGEVVELSGTVNGDVYAAGGQLIVDGNIDGDLLIAGGTVTIAGEVSQDVRVAGGQVNVSGRVGRNLTVAGGNISVTNGASIAGNIVGVGGNMEILAPIGGDLKLGVGNLVISDAITGDVEAAVGSLRLTSDASILGDLTYMSEEPASVEESQVIGDIEHKDSPVGPKASDFDQEKVAGIFAGIWTFFEIVGLISKLIVGLLFIHLYPRFSRATYDTLKKQPWKSLGIGFVTLILTPIIVLALMVTIIGIPLGLILGVSYGIGIYFAGIVAMLYVGLFIVERLKKNWNDGWAFIIGLVVLTILKIIPILGWLIAFFALLLGLGSLVTTKIELYDTLRKKKLV